MSTHAKPELVAALEFQDLFRTDSGNDDSELDDNGASSFADPVGNLVRKFSNDALSVDGVRECSWDAPMAPPFAKVSTAVPFTNPMNFSKSSIGYQLGVVRVEQEIVDGERYSNAYNAAGECVKSLRVTE
jgi:hypothetical protein